MKRTQLNFDEKTYYQLVSYAREKQTSLSGAVRELVSKQINKAKTSTMGDLLELVELGKKSRMKLPRDLSENHDYYLYGEGNPKFANRKK